MFLRREMDGGLIFFCGPHTRTVLFAVSLCVHASSDLPGPLWAAVISSPGPPVQTEAESKCESLKCEPALTHLSQSGHRPSP